MEKEALEIEAIRVTTRLGNDEDYEELAELFDAGWKCIDSPKYDFKKRTVTYDLYS